MEMKTSVDVKDSPNIKDIENLEKKENSPKITGNNVKLSESDESEEVKEKQKESYSSFLIRMLEQTPKKTKTFYNIKLSKTVKKNNPFNINFSPKTKKGNFPFNKNLKNNFINKKYYIKNQFLPKNHILSSPERENNGTSIIKKFNSTQLNRGKRNIFNSFELKNNNKNNSNKLKPNININKSINSNSNLLTKSIILKNLRNKKNRIKNFHSVNNINLNRNKLNELYGYDNDFIESKKNLLKNKDSTNLEKYQNNILKVAQRNLSKDHMIKLFSELQSIKSIADLVKPLPPINYRALVMHSFKEAEDTKRHISKMSFKSKKPQDMDDYEKELYTIKINNIFKRAKIIRNKRMYKIYEILPEYVINALFRNRNKFIII